MLQTIYNGIFHVSSYTRNGLFYAPVFLVLGYVLSRQYRSSSDTPAHRPSFSMALAGFGVCSALLLAEGITLKILDVQRHDSMYLALVPLMYFLFCILLGIFAVGAPGVPGGTVMASLGLIISVLGFDDTGTGLMMTIFALQDSFGTACNVTGDGALTLMLTGYAKKHNIQEVQSGEIL